MKKSAVTNILTRLRLLSIKEKMACTLVILGGVIIIMLLILLKSGVYLGIMPPFIIIGVNIVLWISFYFTCKNKVSFWVMVAIAIFMTTVIIASTN